MLSSQDPALFAVSLCALIYALLSLWLTRRGAPLPPDAIEYAEVARSLVSGSGYTINLIEIHPGLLPSVRHLHELHGLLQPIVLSPLFFLWGPDAALVRIPTLIFAALLGPTTFAVGRHYYGPVAGVVATGLVFLRTDIATVAALGGDDVGWALFSTVALLCFAKSVNGRGKVWLTLAGCAAALATLEKFSGAALAVVFAIDLVVTRKRRSTVELSDWARLLMPVSGVVAVYAVRNYLLHGGLGFRFSALDWLTKEDFFAYFAFYEKAPTVSEMWSRLGPSGVAPLILRQFQLLVWVAQNDALLLIGGPLALVWLAWRKSPFALLGLLYTAAIVLVVCVAYHLEQRYLFALYPIFCVALGAAASSLVQRIHQVLRASWVRPVQGALVTIAVVVFLVEFRKVVSQVRDMGRAAAAKGACDDAVAFIRRSVKFDAPILTSSPWFVAWATERPAVNAPTNGEEAVVRVVNHYRTDWAIDGLPSFGAADVEALLKGLARAHTPIRPELAYHGAVCSVYRLHRAP